MDQLLVAADAGFENERHLLDVENVGGGAIMASSRLAIAGGQFIT